jgi:hypothetical protein
MEIREFHVSMEYREIFVIPLPLFSSYEVTCSKSCIWEENAVAAEGY